VRKEDELGFAKQVNRELSGSYRGTGSYPIIWASSSHSVEIDTHTPPTTLHEQAEVSSVDTFPYQLSGNKSYALQLCSLLHLAVTLYTDK